MAAGRVMRALAALALIALGLGRAAAQPVSARAQLADGRRLAIDTPVPAARRAPAVTASPVIYLERCRGGCAIRLGANDARTGTSMIPKAELSTVGEFASAQGQIGAAADADWAAIVRCVREVYSPYAVTITDVKPDAGTSYHEAIIAGRPADVGMTNDVLGAAPLASNCSAIDNVISFTFANRHPPVGRTYNVCWTAAQESAHAFGLDHEYAFSNNRSACSDPMTYRADCGGEKFFRNEAATCGETAARACKCGGTQSSHQKLLSVFGAGTPITTAPTITMMTPIAGDAALGSSVTASAGAQRGVARVDLVINGFPWATAPGAKFLFDGQPDPASYSITVPATLPDSILDIQTIAYDDLEVATAAPVVTLTKGAPCASAATCATAQRCEAGRCLWDPPAGELGEACSYPQFCKSLHCDGPAGGQVCSQACSVSASDSCPGAFLCEALTAGSDDGVCVVTSAGCCRADRGGAAGWLPGATALVVLGLVRRRRRPLRSQSPTDDDSP